MKRILILAFCALMLVSLGTDARADETAESYITVSTAAELKAIANAPEGSYRLTADIDMAEVSCI